MVGLYAGLRSRGWCGRGKGEAARVSVCSLKTNGFIEAYTPGEEEGRPRFASRSWIQAGSQQAWFLVLLRVGFLSGFRPRF